MGQQEGTRDHNTVRRMAFRDPRGVYQRITPSEFSRENASACVTACFEEFIPNVEDACRQLQHPEHQRTRLWDLYCCDSVNCGVYIGNVGQSPNVDLIINECQNIGFSSIEDPGPPTIHYCASSTPDTSNTSLPPQTFAVEPSIISGTIIQSANSQTPYTVSTSHTHSFPLATPVPLAPSSTLTDSTISTSSPTPTGAKSPQLTGGAKAAISLFSIIAVLAIIALLLLLFRRRRKGPRSSSLGVLLTPYDNRQYPGPRTGSLTPLITPSTPVFSRNAPLTPPAKLSDRRYLQPVLKEGASRPSESLHVSSQIFPSSPMPASPRNGTVPRHKRGETTSSIHTSTTTTAPTRSHHPQSSVYSSSSGPGTSTITIDSNKASSVHSGSATVIGTCTPPLSTTIFPRVHPGSLELSESVTPAGPPPSRALPAPPLNQPNSPSFSVSTTSPRSPTFPGPALLRGDTPIVSTPKRATTETSASISAKELRDLTESYTRDARESWGSWSGVGGGGPGVNAPNCRKSRGNRSSRERRGDTKRVMTLDLEKLGGGY
ncbi:hypothetical protein F5Y03DRAFT_391299 [Xylaria venustula]|nr:hypothetical protein F5Y03DRAFT_391299 [Xylaria venustula]